ncbi:hypothetical protein [Kineococcus mangrovi]|uniref:hypothetical protein n=1 Tax=Kineococcus mangrovi TaxID=1660183 RepID=UPI003D7D5FA5
MSRPPRHRRLAVNPLPWVLGPDGFDLSEQTLTTAMSELGPLGFTALQADVPQGWSAQRYRALLEANGFSPAPGYFGGDFADRDALGRVVEAARRHAATQAELGLDVCFLAHDLVPERIAAPATGVNPSTERTLSIADGMAAGGGGGPPPPVGCALDTPRA